MLGLLVDAVTDYAIFALADDGTILTWNRGAQRLKGYSAEEAIGIHFSCFYTSEDRARNHPANELKIAAEKGRYEEEGWRVRKDGSRFWANVVITPLRDLNGLVTGYAKVTSDLTERKIAEDELRRTLSEIHGLYNNAPCGYHSLDANGYFKAINDTELRWLGYTREEIIGKLRFIDISTPESFELFQREFPLYKKRGFVRNMRFDCRRKDGSILPLLLSSTAVYDEHGNFILTRTSTFDATELKKSEEEIQVFNQDLEKKIQERTARLKLIQEVTEALAKAVTVEEVAEVAVSKALAAFGANAGSVFLLNEKAQTLEQVAWSGVDEQIAQKWKTVPLEASTMSCEVVKTGTPFFINSPDELGDRYAASGQGLKYLKYQSCVCMPLIHQNKVLGVFSISYGVPTIFTEELKGYIQAISSQCAQALERATLYASLEKTVEDRTTELTQSRAFLDSLVENIPNMIFVKEAKDLRFVRFNKAGESLIGSSRDELVGKNDFDFFPKDQADFFIAKDRAVLSGQGIVDIPEEMILTKSNGTRILHTKKIPIFGKDGNPEYLLGISEDITKKKEAEEERLRFHREQAALEERDRANKRNDFLAEASFTLASSLDYHKTLQRLTELAVPGLADWCTITICSGGDTYARVAAAHRDETKAVLLKELESNYPAHCDESNGMDYIVKSGKSLLTSLITEEELKKVARDERHFEIMRDLGSFSCMLVPIPGHGKIHGSIAFVSGESKRVFQPDDLGVAEELGRRAGIAIDNAFLYSAAQDAIRARDEFLSIASHELKTPITSLKLQIQMTKRRIKPESNLLPTAESLTKVFDSSGRQIDRLTHLVEDLLDVSRIQSGKLDYNFEDVVVAELVDEVIERFSDQLSDAGSSLELEVQPNLMAHWDRSRIEQVLVNLISNAIKYAPRTPILLVVTGNEKMATIVVRDQGPGIPQDRQSKIFERFERATASRNISGLGLGLFIVREIVSAHQGSIRVESKSGEGTSFVVDLPLRPIKKSNAAS